MKIKSLLANAITNINPTDNKGKQATDKQQIKDTKNIKQPNTSTANDSYYSSTTMDHNNNIKLIHTKIKLAKHQEHMQQ